MVDAERTIKINWDPLSSHETVDNDQNQFLHTNYQAVQHSQGLFALPCKTSATLHVDIREGQVFRVDEETNVLTEEDLQKHWHDFQASDEAEICQFIDEKAFSKLYVSKVTDEVVVVDCTWVPSVLCC